MAEESNGSGGLNGYVKVLLVSVTAGALGAGGLATVVPEAMRPLPFTSADAETLKEKVLQEVARQSEIDHLLLMQGIPPDSVREALAAQRKRLYVIEEHLRQLDPGFKPAPTF